MNHMRHSKVSFSEIIDFSVCSRHTGEFTFTSQTLGHDGWTVPCVCHIPSEEVCLALKHTVLRDEGLHWGKSVIERQFFQVYHQRKKTNKSSAGPESDLMRSHTKGHQHLSERLLNIGGMINTDIRDHFV